MIDSDKTTKEKLGCALRTIRLRTGRPQEDVAAEAELSRTYYGDLERGYNNPSALALVKIARTLGCTVSEIMAEAGL